MEEECHRPWEPQLQRLCAMCKGQRGSRGGCRRELKERAVGDRMRQEMEGRAEPVEGTLGACESSDFQSVKWEATGHFLADN